MKLQDSRTPVVVLHCALGALSIMRTLGRLGVRVYGVSNNRRDEALRSRYCHKSFHFRYDLEPTEKFIDFLLELGADFNSKPILIATSDETAIAVAEHYGRLTEHYLIGQNSGSLVAILADKKTMFDLARAHELPAPKTVLPKDLEEARQVARSIDYPVMLKGAMGNKLQQRTGKKMVAVDTEEELLSQYQELEDPDEPNVMIQELIPGDDDEVFIFNGYFDADSECLAGFTGRKIRQYPIHVGCASLGECCWVQEVADITINFMKAIKYRGILDIGYRRDPRDGSYKVLDINPRVGQAFRLFTSKDDWDVVRALYADLSGQPIESSIVPREGRRWVIEDYDLTSTVHYFQERSLTVGSWLKSYSRLEEAAWFSMRDPVPFLLMMRGLGMQVWRWLWKRIVPRARPARA